MKICNVSLFAVFADFAGDSYLPLGLLFDSNSGCSVKVCAKCVNSAICQLCGLGCLVLCLSCNVSVVTIVWWLPNSFKYGVCLV